MKNKMIKLKVQCPSCDGSGRVYLGERDPIEGNKMRDVVNCPVCLTSGEVDVQVSARVALAAAVCALAELDDVKDLVAKAVDNRVTEIFNTWKKTL